MKFAVTCKIEVISHIMMNMPTLIASLMLNSIVLRMLSAAGFSSATVYIGAYNKCNRFGATKGNILFLLL